MRSIGLAQSDRIPRHPKKLCERGCKIKLNFRVAKFEDSPCYTLFKGCFPIAH